MEQSIKTQNKGFGKWIGLIVLVIAQIGTSGDNAVLSVATASLLTTLNATMSDIQLANIVYSLCAGCLMIVGGLLGLIIGWNLNFRIGAILCAIGELVVATSSNIVVFTWLGRLSVGLGASLMIPSVLGLIAGLYKGKERAVAFGAIGAATGIATFAGPIVAGLLIDTFDWRIAFGFMALYFTTVVIGSFFIGKVEKPENKVRFDWIGSIIAVFGLFMFIIGISKIPVWGLINPINPPLINGSEFTLFGLSPALPLALMGLVVLIILIPIERNIERKHGSCLIPSSFLTTPQVRNGLYLTAMLFLCFGGVFFLIIAYMQLVGGFSAVQTGLAMSAMALPMVIFSLGVPKFLPDASPKLISRLGIILTAIGTVPIALSIQLDGVSAILYVGLFIFGIGQGLVASQSANVIALAVNTRDAQQSGGIQTATRNVGQAVGVAILGVVMLFSLTGNLQDKVNASEQVSQEVQQFIESQSSIPFTSNDQFIEMVSVEIKDPAEVKALVQMYAETRQESLKLGLYVLGGLVFLFLFGTSALPSSSANKYEKVANETTVS